MMKTKAEEKVSILFICLGNICRSPAAHAVMQHLVDERGWGDLYLIDSAGIGGWHVGQLPDKRMRECGRQRGYNVDKIVVMDEDNYRNITSQAPNETARKKVIRMVDFFTQHPSATCVPDPYYGGTEDFNFALDLIEDGCEGILKALSNH